MSRSKHRRYPPLRYVRSPKTMAQARAALWSGRTAALAYQSQRPPWELVAESVYPHYRCRLDLDWYRLPIENLVWVQTRYYHPRWRRDAQMLDALIMLEFSFYDTALGLESPACWYWYALRAQQVHYRMRYVRALVQRGFWGKGAFELYTPDGSGYLIRRDCILEYSYDPYPDEDGYDFVCLWIGKVQRVVSFLAPTERRAEWEHALVGTGQPAIVTCDFTDSYSWETSDEQDA